MWASRLFWKLFLSYAGLNLASAAAFVLIFMGRYEAQTEAQLQQRLRDAAMMVRDRVGDETQPPRSAALNADVQRLGNAMNLRVTIVTPDGVVLADSRRDAATMENHRGRPELIEALEKGFGTSRRLSPTLNEEMFYSAVRLDRDGKPAALVRTALPAAAVQQEITETRRLIWAFVGAVSLAVLALTWWVVARITSPVATLNEAAHHIADGDYDQRVYVSNRDELGELGESFNRMSRQMSGRVSQLRESGQRLETVLRGMIEGVIAVDDRQRILFANDAAGRLLEFSPAAAVGRAMLETVRHHALHQAAVDALGSRGSEANPSRSGPGGPKTASPPLAQNHSGRTAAEPLRPVTRRLEITLSGPVPRVLATHVARLPGEPCPGVVLVLDDVTELRRLENLRRDFVANVSHELKTPLSSIKAYAETLLSGALEDPENRTAFVARIDEQADRLHQLIQDVLSLARIESGADVHHIAAVAVAELVETCLLHHAPAAEAKRIELGCASTLDGLHVAADREGLREILDNLVDNAIKYTSDGGRVTIRARVDDGQAVLEVEDTGIGIAPDDQPRVFERFYRVDRARSRELGGTGLGLAIVKHLVQAFGGSLSLVSTPGRGSTFSVRLRLAEP